MKGEHENLPSPAKPSPFSRHFHAAVHHNNDITLLQEFQKKRAGMGVKFCAGNMFELWNYKIGLQELKVKRNEANEVYVRNVRKKKWLTCTITCTTAHSTASHSTSKKYRTYIITALRFTVNYWGGNKSLCEPSKQQKTSASTYYWTMQSVLEKPSLMLLSRASFILPSRHLPKKKKQHFNLYLSFPVYGPWTKRTVHVYKDVYKVPQRLKSVLIAATQVLSGYTKRCTLSIDRCFLLCSHMRSYLTAHRSDIKKIVLFCLSLLLWKPCSKMRLLNYE